MMFLCIDEGRINLLKQNKTFFFLVFLEFLPNIENKEKRTSRNSKKDQKDEKELLDAVCKF
jgi:hypothetical protein